MRTKELIRRLQEADPSGELEVSVNNTAIYMVYTVEAYWDGCQEVLKIDNSRDDYNVIGAELRSKGIKVVIEPLSIQDVLFNDFDMLITYDSEYAKEHYEDYVKEWRNKSIELHKKMLKQLVVEWLPNVLKKIKDGWKIVQPLETEPGHYNVLWYLRGDPEKVLWYNPKSTRIRNEHRNFKMLCQGECEVVIELGCFKPVCKEKYIEWEKMPGSPSG